MAGVITEEDEDMPRLSAHTLAALQEFLSEQGAASPLEEDSNGGQAAAAAEEDDGPALHEDQEKDVSLVPEDWRLSQFWYDPLTSQTVAQELCRLSQELNSPIACVSCPSLYVELKKCSSCEVQLFEYDQRFKRYGSDFTFYDYNSPEDLPLQFEHAFQVVVADPPYLSEECLVKTVCTMKLLAKDGESRLLLLTGAVQQEQAQKLLGAHPCGFRPSHGSKLGNEFMLFTNYDPQERLGGWEQL